MVLLSLLLEILGNMCVESYFFQRNKLYCQVWTCYKEYYLNNKRFCRYIPFYYFSILVILMEFKFISDIVVQSNSLEWKKIIIEIFDPASQRNNYIIYRASANIVYLCRNIFHQLSLGVVFRKYLHLWNAIT